MEEDVELVCDVVKNLCNHFFGAAPKLLNGLEFEKIASHPDEQ
jgi:hypothetical protein